jgi:hypothetical protein
MNRVKFALDAFALGHDGLRQWTPSQMAGVFNATRAGTMLHSVVFSVINKGADDTVSTL